MQGTSKSQWEYIYQSIPAEQIPWETGRASKDLVRLIQKQIIKKRMKILDVGCGLGTQTRHMAKNGAIATGLDISETAIKKAREQLLKQNNAHIVEMNAFEKKVLPIDRAHLFANFVVGDVGKMPFPKSSFDFVYDRGCYHHLTPKMRKDYIREVKRVLHSNGLLHMLFFAGTVSIQEVIDYFLPHFSVVEAYEDFVIDHTNNDQETPVHICRFQKI